MEDKYLWLEDVHGDEALEWVKSKNAKTSKDLFETQSFKDNYSKAKECLNSKDKLFKPSVHGKYTYSFWRDEKNPKGIYRRLLTKDLINNTDPHWDVVFDMDQYAKENNENLSWHGAEHNADDNSAIFMFSDGGTDEDEGFEFNLIALEFVKNGIFFSKSKGGLAWAGLNKSKKKEKIVFTRSYSEDDLTESGYSRVVRLLTDHSEDPKDAKVLYKTNKTSIFIYSKYMQHSDQTMIVEGLTFYDFNFLIINASNILKLNLPKKMDFYDFFEGEYVFLLHENFLNYQMGDCVSFQFDDQGNVSQHKLLFSPTAQQSIEYCLVSKLMVLLVYNDNVNAKMLGMKLDNHQWKSHEIHLGENISINYNDVQPNGNDLFSIIGSFNFPNSLIYTDLNTEKSKVIKETKSLFNHKDLVVKQRFSTSKDGTKIPYFIVHHKDIKYDGTNKTILYGYGGFMVSMTPVFSQLIGKLWLDKKHVYVLSNIRGGGEFGPKWHQSVLKEKRHKAYEDFFSVAEDLIEQKVTAPKHLGAMGGSNGGLLMGVCLTQRSDLFQAINCGVPLLDMLRYHKLLAGASWVGEYGSPDVPAEREYLLSYSPYHNLDSSKKYSNIFINTSTRDDRVHPAHARKMAAKMDELGLENTYFENLFGGHGASNSNDSLAKLYAAEMTFFDQNL